MGTDQKKHGIRFTKAWIMSLCTLFIVFMAAGYISVMRIMGTEQDNSESYANTAKIEVTGNQYRDYITSKANAISDIEYGTAKNYKGVQESLKLDVYSPDMDAVTTNDQSVQATTQAEQSSSSDQTNESGQSSSDKRPAIIMVHGGGFHSGDKANESITKRLSEDFARMGYVVFNVNYRLEEVYSKSAYSNALVDVANAFNWVEDHSSEYGIDPDRIFIGGHSAGAVISVDLVYSNNSKLNIKRSSVAGVIDLSGMKLHNGKPKEGNAPCIIIHGTKDTTDPYSESEKLLATLQEAKVGCQLYPLKGLNHDLSIAYDEVRNQAAMFMYHQLTGEEVQINMVSENDPEYDKVEKRIAENPTYTVKQLDVTLDGNLDEWKDCEVMPLNQLMDMGKELPSSDNFSGNVMVAWNPSNPTMIYLAATITDDVLQTENKADGKWYNNDCFEIAFDLSRNHVPEQFAKWVVSADGKERNILATDDNMKVVVNKTGNTLVYEMAIDLSKVEEYTYRGNDTSKLSSGDCIGLNIAYDDADHGTREYQIGWQAGKFSERLTMGNLRFE